MEWFCYIGECGIQILRYSKEELAWITHICFQFISNAMLLKTVTPLRN